MCLYFKVSLIRPCNLTIGQKLCLNDKLLNFVLAFAGGAFFNVHLVFAVVHRLPFLMRRIFLGRRKRQRDTSPWPSVAGLAVQSKNCDMITHDSAMRWEIVIVIAPFCRIVL